MATQRPADWWASEEPEASTLFDQVLEELGLLFHPPLILGPQSG
jgi:hypothetical protein